MVENSIIIIDGISGILVTTMLSVVIVTIAINFLRKNF